jgi:hypothetical protein
MRGEMPRVITGSQEFGRERSVCRVLPLFNSDEIIDVQPAWSDTKYYQDKNGKLRRKDGKKIRHT